MSSTECASTITAGWDTTSPNQFVTVIGAEGGMDLIFSQIEPVERERVKTKSANVIRFCCDTIVRQKRNRSTTNHEQSEDFRHWPRHHGGGDSRLGATAGAGRVWRLGPRRTWRQRTGPCRWRQCSSSGRDGSEFAVPAGSRFHAAGRRAEG